MKASTTLYHCEDQAHQIAIDHFLFGKLCLNISEREQDGTDKSSPVINARSLFFYRFCQKMYTVSIVQFYLGDKNWYGKTKRDLRGFWLTLRGFWLSFSGADIFLIFSLCFEDFNSFILVSKLFTKPQHFRYIEIETSRRQQNKCFA